MVDIEVEYKSGKTFPFTCHHFDNGKAQKGRLLIYKTKTEIQTNLDLSKIKEVRVVK